MTIDMKLSFRWYRCFSSKRGMHHYLSMAVGNYRGYLKGEHVRMKKYLYVLRPILACKWILAYGTPPPMRFDALAQELLEERLKPVVAELLEKKMRCSECELTPAIDALNDYIEENLPVLSQRMESLGEPPEDMTTELDRLFLKLVS